MINFLFIILDGNVCSVLCCCALCKRYSHGRKLRHIKITEGHLYTFVHITHAYFPLNWITIILCKMINYEFRTFICCRLSCFELFYTLNILSYILVYQWFCLIVYPLSSSKMLKMSCKILNSTYVYSTQCEWTLHK